MILTSQPFVFPATIILASFEVDLFVKKNSNNTVSFSPLLEMTTLRSEKKIAAINRENHEENPRRSQAGDANLPRIQDEYIAHVSEKIEGRVTKKLSQEYSRTESRILGALSKTWQV